MELRDQLQNTLGASYTLERELGGGGMARVFVAEETRLARKVVVKVLSPELAAGISSERFEREIKVSASLQQANIVPVLSAGETGGTPYYTMPYVDGESLGARLRSRGALPIREVVSVLRDVARALAYAHERGIVHRDIKPDNVLLSGGAAVVSDFGIAKAISASRTHAEGPTLTQLGMAVGTPAYIAPEQAAGDPDIDHRADIYSFGCMAYEMLTGQPPFADRGPQRLIAAHMNETPRPLLESRPDAPPALAAMVMQCLEKHAAARPQSAADLMLAFDAKAAAGDGAIADTAAFGRGRTTIAQALAVYIAAFIAVAVLAKASIVGIGLPDWVLTGALLIMALGLPVILFTGFAQHVARRQLGAATATQGTMANLAVKASPHVSWRRAALGGVYALGSFVVLIGIFMLLRALGIGPPGSLLAAGRLARRAPVVITDFRVTNTDSALGTVVSDAVRAGLSQSSVVSLVSPAAVAAELRLMNRSPTSRLDLALAREVAQRQGVQAIADGSVTGVPGGYILTLRLVTADSGLELASFREPGDGPRGLIDAADKLARELRGKIGESLRSVQASPPLERVTTASLDALRKYSAANRANNLEGDFRKAISLASQAVVIDTNFASAWRLLAVAMTNAGASRTAIDSTIERAYRHADRLPEPERSQTIGSYFTGGPHRDRTKALAVYESILARGDSDVAAINAGEVLRSRRAFAQAESLNLAAIRQSPIHGVPYLNAIELRLDQNKLAAAESLLRVYRQRIPGSHQTAIYSVRLAYQAGDLRRAELALDSLSASADAEQRTFGLVGGADLAAIEGRLAKAERLYRQAGAGAVSSPRDALSDSVTLASADAWFRGTPERAVARIDGALDQIPLHDIPVADRPYFQIATAYARTSRPDKARAVIAAYRADVADTALLRLQAADLHDVLGEIALAEKKPADALAEFRRGDVDYDGQPARECGPCLAFNLARAFDAAGMADSAIAAYERFIATPYYNRLNDTDPQGLAGAHKRLGELYEAKGNRQRAASHYQRFIDLWKDADPELQPRVAEARRRLARLSDVERP